MTFDAKMRVVWASLAIPAVLLGIGASYKSGGLSGLRDLALDALHSVGIQRQAEPLNVPSVPVEKNGTATSITLPADEVFWRTIKDSNEPALFEEFVTKFPSSPHAQAARVKLEELKEDKASRASARRPENMPMGQGGRAPMMMGPKPK